MMEISKQEALAVLFKALGDPTRLRIFEELRCCGPAVEIDESGKCRPAGAFHGPMVVSMRPIPSAQLAKAVTASARFPNAHGAPIHVGDPAAIGIEDITRPDWGDAQEFRPGDVPVFWACGVTPQAVALASKPPFMITHSPGHMFITDLPNSALAAL